MALNIAQFGCGTVGAVLTKQLLTEHPSWSQQVASNLQLQALCSRSFEKLGFQPPPHLLARNEEEILTAPDIDVVVELIGGCDDAYRIVKEALLAGKHVVTANKALLAEHADELFPLAKKQRCCLLFEASCGGGIPLISTLQQGLLANRINSFYGILNGSCNFILHRIEEGSSFQEALEDARKEGLVEANPNLDLNGSDSVHKLALLAAMSFCKKIDYKSITAHPLSEQFCEKLALWRPLLEKSGHSVRFVAQARWRGETLALWVAPTLLARNEALAQVYDANNSVFFDGDLLGKSSYYGLGAGGRATVSAVLADLLSLEMGTTQQLWHRGIRLPGFGDTAPLCKASQLTLPLAYISQQETFPHAHLHSKQGAWKLFLSKEECVWESGTGIDETLVVFNEEPIELAKRSLKN